MSFFRFLMDVPLVDIWVVDSGCGDSIPELLEIDSGFDPKCRFLVQVNLT